MCMFRQICFHFQENQFLLKFLFTKLFLVAIAVYIYHQAVKFQTMLLTVLISVYVPVQAKVFLFSGKSVSI